jgi:hypothetical protein
MPPLVDLTGKKFKRLLVMKMVERTSKVTYWECLCECGNITILPMGALRSGHTSSCGCLRYDANKGKIPSNKRHGISKTPIYYAWANMLKRCTDPKNDQYYNYGARGIKPCEKWMTCEGFLEDMQESYSKGLTLDRLDNDKGYSKENCKWSTLTEQANNKRNNTIVEFRGETERLIYFLEKYNIKRHQYYSRIKIGWSVEDALTKPIKKSIRNKAI